MPVAKYLMLCALCVEIGSWSSGLSGAEVSAGPLYDKFRLTLSSGERTEAVGPLLSLEHRDAVFQWGLSPLFSFTQDPETDFEEWDLLYPLLTYDRFGSEYRFQIIQWFSIAGGRNQETIPKTRFSLFPFYFQQTSPDPDQRYAAFFPLYGHLKNRFLRDEIRFVLFPLYARTRKRDVITDNVVYPFFHVRRGNALHGWQLWPALGLEHKAVTTRTNTFDEVETIGGHERFFALWPFFLKQTSGIGTDNPQKQFAMLPLYNHLRSPLRDSTTVLWPFFTWTDDRERKYREWDGPWPFVVVARGEGKTTTRFLPLFSRAHSPTLESAFYLWPLYKYNAIHSPPLERQRTRILFFLFSNLTEQNLETGAKLRRADFWPLFTFRRGLDGNQRLQLLSLLEPLLPNNKSIERNYSPLWSLWRSEKNAKTGATSQSLLWNLYRRDTTSETRECSFLFGLFQKSSGPEGNRWRLFYIPVGRTKSAEEPRS